MNKTELYVSGKDSVHIGEIVGILTRENTQWCCAPWSKGEDNGTMFVYFERGTKARDMINSILGNIHEEEDDSIWF